MRALIHRPPPLGQAVAVSAICLVTVWLVDRAFSLVPGPPEPSRVSLLGAPVVLSVRAYVMAVRSARG